MAEPFPKFEVRPKYFPDGKETIVLYNPDDNIEIDERTYQYIHQYIQTIFNIFPDEKITSVPTMKKWFIDSDRRKLKNEKYKKDKNENIEHSMLSIISSCVNHPGFKYKTSELKEIHVSEFYDSVQRLQIYEHTTAVLKGMFSGFVDSKKIKPEAYNFMQDLHK